MKNKAVSHPIPALREDLRLQACAVSGRLSRSVARMTSCEAEPCLEYGNEVKVQQELVRRLLYLQHCRDALEKCIGGSWVTVRFHRSDGTLARTFFRRWGVNQVKVTGFLAE